MLLKMNHTFPLYSVELKVHEKPLLFCSEGQKTQRAFTNLLIISKCTNVELSQYELYGFAWLQSPQ